VIRRSLEICCRSLAPGPTSLAALSAAGIQSASIVLTASQVTNLTTTPVQFLAARGNGLMYNVIQLVYNVNVTGTAFSASPSIQVGFFANQLPNPTQELAYTPAATSVVTRSSSAVFIEGAELPLPSGTTSGLLTDMVNQPLIIFDAGGGATGGSGSTFTIQILYRVISVS
jgi:hypothetical protein